MYNIFEVCYACLLLYYFGRLLTHKRSAFVLLGLGIAFVLSSILIFIVSKGVFFGQISSYVTITGAFLLLIGISFYLIELLQGKLSLKEIGRASCRERVKITVVVVLLQEKRLVRR